MDNRSTVWRNEGGEYRDRLMFKGRCKKIVTPKGMRIKYIHTYII